MLLRGDESSLTTSLKGLLWKVDGVKRRRMFVDDELLNERGEI